MPNRARAYLQRVYPDRSSSSIDAAASAGLLTYTETLLGALRNSDRAIGPPNQSIQAIAADLEARQLATLLQWRDDLADRVQNPSLREVEVAFIELSSPQAIAVHEPKGSVAVGMDRRLNLFLSTAAAWAYATAGAELDGVPARPAREPLLAGLADLLQVTYLSRAVPPNAEGRLLALLEVIGESHRGFVDALSSLATKFVFYHELGHVHLGHFGKRPGLASPSADGGRLAAFEDEEMEFEADQFASEQLTEPTATITSAITAKLAPVVFLQVLTMKEAMAPSDQPATRAIQNAHPPYARRAERVVPATLPPAFLPQFAILYRMIPMLDDLIADPAFAAAAAFFKEKSFRQA